MAVAYELTTDTYVAVPLVGLVAAEAPGFPLYLRTGDDVWVLYRAAYEPLDEGQLGRLRAEGIQALYVRELDAPAYYAHVERALEAILRTRQAPLAQRANVLHGVGQAVVRDLLLGAPDRALMDRAHKVMLSACGLLHREQGAMLAVRSVLAASRELAEHSLSVGLLCMGVARIALSPDSTAMVQAGLAGLLHDIGKVGNEGHEHDPEHAERGAELLRGWNMPRQVVEATRAHHERWDGSGYPHGLRGSRIPPMARIVGLVNTFQKVHADQAGRGGVYAALRVLAQAYRGCFEDRMAMALVQLFRAHDTGFR